MAFKCKIAQRLGEICATLLLVIIFAANEGAAVAQTFERKVNCDISGGTNNGIQIQNCPTIIQAPTPTFHVTKEFPIVKNLDGTFTRSAEIVIDAPYVPGNMLIGAFGPTVTKLTVTNHSVVVGGAAKDPSMHVFYVSEPWGKYIVNIITSDDAQKPTLQVQFNADVNVE